ncbi:FxsB family radical SAM/SPASM domain protein [Streptomyces sp. KM273126]|uniref:radical SAM/SPASM protein FxsBH, inactivated beta-hydroxylase extension form n=1 Tax=Streptomyces sp. KM273126 TaxID=2545247 RepID=UPI00103F438F|nr:radical SAM/SPASM protein FxsB, inactivated metallohydrolase extension form [Streptomyces sp. KM273126]MBA2805944.1 FxsB family radical SAM/SPASM domain protein [Streptomyces sp. KM273126]
MSTSGPATVSPVTNVAPALQQLVLKVHSRCDLACDHCYVYEHADQSWSRRPKVISEKTAAQAAHQLAIYAKERELPSVSVILHGGEPLLAGPDRLRRICEELKAALSPVTSLDLRIHTNGVQLSRRFLEVFKEFGVTVGISLDGDRAANDRHRLDRRGHSSYDRVLRAIGLLRTPEYRHLYGGLLCTVDVANDPVAVHDALVALAPPRIDYLLPHSTWDSPPPRPDGSPTPYADWLLAVYDRWEQQGRTVPVRIFESVHSTLRGGPSLTESLGLAPSDLAVVETDGTFEQADSLKTAYDGAAGTGYDVFEHSFQELADHPGVRARQQGIDGVSDTCHACPVVDSCGGGLYAHRYSSAGGFDNPSVFCADLRAFIESVAGRLDRRALAAVARPDELRLEQLELNRLLLIGRREELAGRTNAVQAWELLTRLEADEGAGHCFDAVLSHPYLRDWLSGSRHTPADAARFMALVAAVAVHARSPAALSWDHPDRTLHLPALGTLTLPEPGRIDVTVSADGFRLRSGPPDAEPGVWRPLDVVDLGDGSAVVVDDADPCRGAYYRAEVAPPLGDDDLDVFGKRLRTAYGLLDERLPHGRTDLQGHTGLHARGITTVTPLVAGSPLEFAARGHGGLGVAVDFEPEEFARELPRAARRAGLAALREVTVLHRAGGSAERLLDEASEHVGLAASLPEESEARVRARDRAARALVELTLLPDGELTGSGSALVGRLWTEWRNLRD